jgi:flagellar biosynthesis/type III secretory pathway protein FliH
MPDLIRRSAIGETRAMLAHVLPGLSREPVVRIEVPPNLVSYVEESCKPLAQRHSGMIVVTGESTMRPGDVRVHWNSGHAGRQPAQIWEAVMEALDPVLNETQSKETVHAE